MFKSILDDIKSTFNYGHMVTRLMIINGIVFVILALIEAFTRNLGYYTPILKTIAMPTGVMDYLFKPWTLITYMFTHEGFWHLVFNMIGLNIFGKIVGDLLGDRKVFPIYLLGGIAGGIIVLIFTPILSNLGASIMVGASASVLALAMVAALVAPDYNIRLMLIGNVRLKYIVLAFILFDLISSQGNANAGGHIAHLGGILFGAFYIYLLRNGNDLSDPINNGLNWIENIYKPKAFTKTHRPVMKVEHRSDKIAKKKSLFKEEPEIGFDDRLDMILEKIKQKGYDNLSKEEKDFLNKASQK